MIGDRTTSSDQHRWSINKNKMKMQRIFMTHDGVLACGVCVFTVRRNTRSTRNNGWMSLKHS
jgi:hypothetical protein